MICYAVFGIIMVLIALYQYFDIFVSYDNEHDEEDE